MYFGFYFEGSLNNPPSPYARDETTLVNNLYIIMEIYILFIKPLALPYLLNE